MSQLYENSKLAVAISREHAINSRLISTDELYCFEKSQIIYEYDLKLFMCTNFPYINELNQFIQMASASGLIKKWRIDNQIRSKIMRKEKNYNQLTLEQGYGYLIIWYCLLAFTFLFVFVEKIIYMKARAPNPSKIWILAEMLIDSDRHFLLETKKI